MNNSSGLRSRWLGYLGVAVVSLLTGCGGLDQGAVGNLKSGLAEMRQLSFTRDVPFEIKSPDEAQRMIETNLTRDNSSDELRLSGAAGAMTGLFPPRIDLKKAELKLARQQIAGFYDPRLKVMVQVRGQSVLGTSMMGRSVFADELLEAHELTHALQDQHFGLQAMLGRVKDDDDEEIALHSMIEGDATLAGLTYVSNDMTLKNVQNIIDHFAALPDSFEPESSGTPLALSAPLMFQYSAGSRFVAEAWKRGGWAAVNALYRNPPQSSQQIIDPSLYFDQPTPPLQIDVRGYEAVLPGWKKADTDTFGELLLKIIFQRNSKDDALIDSIPPTWRGDRMVILTKGSALSVLWVIAFTDRDAASKFATIYSSMLDHLREPRSKEHRLDVRNNSVLIVIGPVASAFDQLAPAVWKATTIRPQCSLLFPTAKVPAGCKPVASLVNATP